MYRLLAKHVSPSRLPVYGSLPQRRDHRYEGETGIETMVQLFCEGRDEHSGKDHCVSLPNRLSGESHETSVVLLV